jgi:hypothetical protein
MIKGRRKKRPTGRRGRGARRHRRTRRRRTPAYSPYVDANKYNRLFMSPQVTVGLLVERELWDLIESEVPQNYIVPDLDVFHHMTAFYRNRQAAG